MKKLRFVTVLFFVTLLAAASFTLAACGQAEKADYSVTVLSAADEPVVGVTVSWRSGADTKGSAVTGADGKATASLPLGTYAVELSGLADGLTYTSVSVGAQMRNVTLSLKTARIEYSAVVTDKNGLPASGVTVTWTSGAAPAGSATTNAEGKAVCELDYGDYAVSVSGLPSGNIFAGALNATGKTPDVQFALQDGESVSYSVTLKSEGGLLFKNHTLRVFRGETYAGIIGSTDDGGVFRFDAVPGDYSVRADLPAGYTVTAAQLTASSRSAEMIARSAVITDPPSSSMRYVMGDIIHNYSFTTPYAVNGAPLSYTVAGILQTKKAVLINNWGVNCSYCVQEMPDMQEAYEKHKDKIEFLAVNNYQGGDSDSTITQYYNQNGYTFPMMRDANGLAAKFGITGWPTTVIIDRYGAIARIEVGAVTGSEAWDRMIQKYIGDDYVQTFTPGETSSDPIGQEIAKPDIVLPADHYEKVNQTLNNTAAFGDAKVTWYGETESDMIWPFLIGTDAEVSPDDAVLYSSNTGKAGTMSAIYATVNASPAQVFTFDYWAQTETSDVFSIVWDGRIIEQIRGDSKGWQTCYLYSELAEGDHSLAFAYVKDRSGNTGKDNVYIKNVRFTDVGALSEPTDMLRSAAYGALQEGDTQYPHYATVRLEQDGYYHVDLSSLHNAQYAGNDDSPLLLVNLLNVTNWANVSLSDLIYAKDPDTGEYAFDCTLTVNDVTKDYRDTLAEYMRTANASDVPDCVPVDQELHDLLVAFMAKVSGNDSHPQEWLEACYFYSHYGSGDPVGNPILGLTEKTAIVVTEGTHTADLTRNIQPFPFAIFAFTPQTSAVYKIQSLIPEKDAGRYIAQLWLYDDGSTPVKPLLYDGDARLVREGVNEQNFTVYRYLEAGHKYYLQTAFMMTERGTFDFSVSQAGQSATVLRPCSDNYYTYDTDKDGKPVGDLFLAGAVKYEKDADGYYHAINPDGTRGDFIYFDVQYATALTSQSISVLVDQYLKVPTIGTVLDYKMFDFRYMIAYYTEEDEEGTYTTYDPKFDLTKYGPTELNRQFRDYTEDVKAYIAKAENGLVKVDDDLVNILTLFFETRISMLTDNVYEQAMDNEWLRLCWYYRTYNEANP